LGFFWVKVWFGTCFLWVFGIGFCACFFLGLCIWITDMDSNPDQDQNPNLKYQKYLGFKKGVLFFVPHFFLADVPHYFQPLIPDVPHFFAN